MNPMNVRHGMKRARPRSNTLPLITLAVLIPVALMLTLILIGTIQDGGY